MSFHGAKVHRSEVNGSANLSMPVSHVIQILQSANGMIRISTRLPQQQIDLSAPGYKHLECLL